jgi:hypothetical protein
MRRKKEDAGKLLCPISEVRRALQNKGICLPDKCWYWEQKDLTDGICSKVEANIHIDYGYQGDGSGGPI